MCGTRAQEAVRAQGVVAVAARRAAVAGNVSPLRVIEHVEGFGTDKAPAPAGPILSESVY